MDAITLFKQAAKALQDDPRYLALDAARKANDADTELQAMIAEFGNLNTAYQQAAMGTPEEQKQIMADRQRMNVPTGKGIFDWKKIKEVADAQGAKAYIVEREWDYLDDIFACVKEDYEYLKNNV